MSRIDVVKSENGIKVMINFIQRGVSYSSALIANREAQKIYEKMPSYKLTLAPLS